MILYTKVLTFIIDFPRSVLLYRYLLLLYFHTVWKFLNRLKFGKIGCNKLKRGKPVSKKSSDWMSYERSENYIFQKFNLGESLAGRNLQQHHVNLCYLPREGTKLIPLLYLFHYCYPCFLLILCRKIFNLSFGWNSKRANTYIKETTRL